MARTRNLEIVISGDAKDLERAFKRAGDAADKSHSKIRGFATITSSGFARVGAAATGMAAIAGGGLALMAKGAVDAASDINESLTKNQTLFGRYARDVEAFSKTSAASFGISRKAALEYAGVFGNLFRAFGTSQRESAKFSVSLTKLAADMASFNNTSIEQALEAIRSGLVGESEPLRAFGVNINETALKAQALSSGLVKAHVDQQKMHASTLALDIAQRNLAKAVKEHGSSSTEAKRAQLTLETAQARVTKAASGEAVQLNAGQKAMAAMQLITKQTSLAHGDFARTSSGAANQQRILRARLSDLQGEIGAKLLPVVVKVTSAVNKFIDGMRRGTGAGGDFARELRKFGNDVHNVERFVSGAVDTGKQFNRWLQSADRAVGKVDSAINSGLLAAFRSLRSQLAAVGDRLNRWIIQPLGKILGIAGKVGSALSGAFDFKVPDFGLIGDGIGKIPSLAPVPGPAGRGASGGLHGADAALSPFAAIGGRFGLHVSSGRFDHSLRTTSGNISYHSTGEAIDLANGAGPDRAKLATFNALKRGFGSRLAELIYTPGGVGIKDGRPHTYTGHVAAEHMDHVHVALDLGRPGPGIGDGPGRGRSDALATIAAAAKKAGIDPSILYGVWGAESNFSMGPGPTSPAGARGPFQFMPATARAMGINPHDFRSAAYGAARYLAQYESRGTAGMLAAYNAGPGAKPPYPAETRRYIPKVISISHQYKGRTYGDWKQGTRGAGAGGAAGAGGGAEPDTTSPYELAIAGSDVEIAEAQQVKPGGFGRGPAMAETAAQRNRMSIVNRRIKKVRKALKKKGLRPATRLRLRNELASLLGERATIAGRIDELSKLPESTDEAVEPKSANEQLQDVLGMTELRGRAGYLSDVQALDARRQYLTQALQGGFGPMTEREQLEAQADLNETVRTLQETLTHANEEAEKQRQAMAEHTQALNSLKDEIAKANQFAVDVRTVQMGQLAKGLADFISGQIGGYGGVGARALTAGAGTVVRY